VVLFRLKAKTSTATTKTETFHQRIYTWDSLGNLNTLEEANTIVLRYFRFQE